MSTTKTIPEKHTHYQCAPTPEVLSSVHVPGINMAVWQRPELPACQEAIETILTASTTYLLDTISSDKAALLRSLQEAALPLNPTITMDALAEDIWMLSELFCTINEIKEVRIRLARIENDACRLFHADTLHMRMLCTYAGAGTDWIENHNARYDQLGSQGRSVEETNDAIVIDFNQIRTVDTWDVALFSGRLKEDTLPLIHRSSPVKNRNAYRIRLCIDFPDACGCE